MPKRGNVNVEIKEAAERGILKLRHIDQEEDSTPEEKIKVIARSDDILKPFLMSSTTNNVKVYFSFLFFYLSQLSVF